MAGPLQQKTVVDLYCGSGFFAIALAQPAQQTFGIETITEAITDAQVNAQLNQVPVQWQAAPAEATNWPLLHPDVLILDPPRAGLQPAVIEAIRQAKPATIVYVSCKHERFVEELSQLHNRYIVTKMRAIDMFPQTPHVELVTQLTRRP